ncbi:MAG: hypothetical protein OEM28_07260 [Nitrosopumilus sp.]|nr:hypothetical protein [Nitrosopumilus sp.]MDH3488061.1 hypothetical protein [Nitrosopumilus sp.]
MIDGIIKGHKIGMQKITKISKDSKVELDSKAIKSLMMDFKHTIHLLIIIRKGILLESNDPKAMGNLLEMESIPQSSESTKARRKY